jgi:hypothetical protein
MMSRITQMALVIVLGVSVLTAAPPEGSTASKPSSTISQIKRFPQPVSIRPRRLFWSNGAIPGIGKKDFSVTINFWIEVGDPEPEPEPEEEVHGPAVHSSARKDVNVRFPCEATLTDNDGYEDDLTIALHLLDPSGQEITPAPPPHWQAGTPYITDSYTWTRVDPVEGTYKCQADNWFYYTYLGRTEYPMTLSYEMPTGETSSFESFFLFIGRFKGHLTGSATFSGRVLHEGDGGNHVDTCHYPGSPIDEYIGVPPSMWDNPVTVNSSGEYIDELAIGPQVIACYRGDTANAPNCFIPVVNAQNTCQFETDQRMYINRPGASPGDQIYKTNRIKKGIGLTWIWSERDGKPGSTPW